MLHCYWLRLWYNEAFILTFKHNTFVLYTVLCSFYQIEGRVTVCRGNQIDQRKTREESRDVPVAYVASGTASIDC